MATDAKAPSGLTAGVKRLWATVTTSYDLRADELRVLEDACREMALVDRLEREITKPGFRLVVKGSMGQPVASPLIQEIRQHRATLQRLLASLKLPDDENGAAAGERSTRARAAAQARWGVKRGA